MPLHEWLPEGHVPLDIPGIPAVALHSTRALLTLAHQGQRAPDMQVPTSILEQESERLLRIFYVLDTAFMRYREATWHMCIRNIKINGGHIIIDEDERKTDRWNGWWSTFPNHINAMKDGPVKASVLATGACHDTGHMVKLMEHLFDGTINSSKPQEAKEKTLIVIQQACTSPSKNSSSVSNPLTPARCSSIPAPPSPQISPHWTSGSSALPHTSRNEPGPCTSAAHNTTTTLSEPSGTTSPTTTCPKSLL